MSQTATLSRRRRSSSPTSSPGPCYTTSCSSWARPGSSACWHRISVHLSFTPVPITGQTLGVLLAGTALGWRRSAAALLVYMVAGLVGVPWFADHQHGYVGASFGYVVGFVLAATLCGMLAEKGADRSVLKSVPAMIAGEVVMYAVGVTWLALSLHVGMSKAISLGLTPFLVGDAFKAALAAGLLPATWRLVGSR